MGRLVTGKNTVEISLFHPVEDLYVCQHKFERPLKFFVIEQVMKNEVCNTTLGQTKKVFVTKATFKLWVGLQFHRIMFVELCQGGKGV